MGVSICGVAVGQLECELVPDSGVVLASEVMELDEEVEQQQACRELGQVELLGGQDDELGQLDPHISHQHGNRCHLQCR